MSVVRIDLNRCIGCKNCVEICPMDVFYFDEKARKSVLAYPENCQSCGQCYLNCRGRAIGMSNDTYGYPITAFRGATSSSMNRMIVTEPGVIRELTKGKLP
ncbi:MAG: ferredoxin family protein [Lachnospiraceae bacterium]|nr:ferredoxin family protein [Lachnospiraceae bacterium]